MKKRHLLLVTAVSLGSLLIPAQSALANECQSDGGADVGCRAQRACNSLADRTHLVSCTQ